RCRGLADRRGAGLRGRDRHAAGEDRRDRPRLQSDGGAPERQQGGERQDLEGPQGRLRRHRPALGLLLHGRGDSAVEAAQGAGRDRLDLPALSLRCGQHLSCRRRQSAPADPLQRQRFAPARAGRAVRRRDPEALRRAWRLPHRRAWRRHREARVDARAVLRRRSHAADAGQGRLRSRMAAQSRQGVSAGRDRTAVTGHMRVGFHAPDTVEELAYLVAEAADTRTPLEVMGRGTKREVGRPVQYGAVLSTENLTGIQLYEPSELVLVARAGTPIGQIEEALPEYDQEMPFEPIDLGPVLAFGRGQGTVGGMVATNFSGSRRILSGSVRDHVLGVQAVNGSGETIRAGGRVMKNVTGYDLSRALSGSWGTLAVMTEVAIKVLPAPREVRTVLCFGLADPNGIEALCLAMGTPCEVSGTVHMHAELAERLSDQEIANAGASVTAIRVENFPASARYRSSRLKQMLQAY